MSDYRSLFGIRVEHEFFLPSRCEAVDFRLDAASTELLARAGILLRHEPDGVHAYYDREQEPLFRSWFGDPGERFRVVFRLTASDPSFPRYTEVAERSGLVCVLDTEVEGPGGAVFSLTPPEEPGAERRELLDKLEAELVTGRDRLVPPLALLVVFLGPSALAEGGHEPYRLTFAARRTRWRYHLLGDLAGRQAFIRDQSPDPADQIRFTPGGMVNLPGERVAQTLISEGVLPLRRRADRRLQLRETGLDSERVLVRRLPVASPENLSIATIDGRQTIVSDIYVNG